MKKLLLALTLLLLISSPESEAQELFQAIQEGDAGLFKQIIERDDSLVHITDPSGNSPLHIAAYFNRTEMVQILLKEGASIQASNSDQRNALVFAVAGNGLECARILLEAGIDVSAKDSEGRQPVHWCAVQGSAGMASLLLKYGANINALDHRMRTALHHTAGRGNIDVAEVLIRNRALVNAVDYHGRTPLFTASWNGHLNLVKMLIENKAVVDARYIGAASPLTTASVANHTELCRYLVSEHADVNLVCNMLVTPIYPAILNNNKELVKLYLDHMAQVNYRDLAGRSPLYVAVRDGYTDIAKMLLAEGADPHFREETTGRTLLHIAASNGRKDITEMLIARGLSVNTEDKKGFTPLDYAVKHGFSELAASLASNGGKKKASPLKPELNDITAKVKTGDAYVTKLRTNTWSVNTKSGMIVFGYVEEGETPGEASLINGSIVTEELQTQAIYHFDGAYSSEAVLFRKQDEFDDIKFICNAAAQRSYASQDYFNSENMFFPGLLETMKIDHMEVTALPGYYSSHQSYLIRTDGLNILWLCWQSDRYKPWEKDIRAVEYLQKNDIPVDLLFVGVPYSDMGPEWISIMEVEYEIAKELDAKAVFPVPGCKMGEYFYHERQRKGDGQDILYAINPGDVFHYKKGEIEKL